MILSAFITIDFFKKAQPYVNQFVPDMADNPLPSPIDKNYFDELCKNLVEKNTIESPDETSDALNDLSKRFNFGNLSELEEQRIRLLSTNLVLLDKLANYVEKENTYAFSKKNWQLLFAHNINLIQDQKGKCAKGPLIRGLQMYHFALSLIIDSQKEPLRENSTFTSITNENTYSQYDYAKQINREFNDSLFINDRASVRFSNYYPQVFLFQSMYVQIYNSYKKADRTEG